MSLILSAIYPDPKITLFYLISYLDAVNPDEDAIPKLIS